MSGDISLRDAVIVFQDLAPTFESHGWILSMYGSTLRNGSGKDLYLIAVPMWDSVERPSSTMLRAGLKVDSHCYHGLMKTEAHKVEYRGIWLDIQFRLVGTQWENLGDRNYTMPLVHPQT